MQLKEEQNLFSLVATLRLKRNNRSVFGNFTLLMNQIPVDGKNKEGGKGECRNSGAMSLEMVRKLSVSILLLIFKVEEAFF